MVIKRKEVPRGEYTYDNAVKLIISYNEIYNPSWVYLDSGQGEYQYERLLLYGEEHPESGLKNKVVRCAFGSSLDIQNPISGIMEKKPFKQFMIEQLVIAFERDRIILSPFDEVLHKQLIDYEVVKQNKMKGTVTYTDKEEHFVDCLAMAHLAFVLEFPEIGDIIQEKEISSKIEISHKSIGMTGVLDGLNDNPWKMENQNIDRMGLHVDEDDSPDRNMNISIYSGAYGDSRNISSSNNIGQSWGSRSDFAGRGGSLRSLW